MTDQQQVPAPTNATEARTALDARLADKEFGGRLLRGDTAARKEFDDLTTLVAKGGDDVISVAMSGDIGEMPDGSVKVMADTAAFLRSLGINDGVIRQTLSDQEVTQAEYDLVANWKADKEKDPEWIKQYLSGSREHNRAMVLANIVLSSPIKQEAA